MATEWSPESPLAERSGEAAVGARARRVGAGWPAGWGAVVCCAF